MKCVSPEQLKQQAMNLADTEGFAASGVADVAELDAGCAERLARWLADGMHANMGYLADRAELIRNPSENFPWARSVLCLGASYATQNSPPFKTVARYAQGRDYHKVLFKAASRVLAGLQDCCPGLIGRVCVDTAPVAERSLAAAAGLGWIGRSGMLVHRIHGTRLLLAEIFLDVALPADAPLDDGCGECRACVAACPNAAIVADGLVDARRCNSWATIEHRGVLDGGAFDTAGYVFGCDCCTDVCPYNRADVGEDRAMADLVTPSTVAGLSVLDILALTPEVWDAVTRGTALRRCGYEGLVRNACLVCGRRGLVEADADLHRIAESDMPIAAQAARWALSRLA